MKKINVQEIIGFVIAGFVIALVISWVPMLGYDIIASVFPLPPIIWEQATAFTWAGFTLYFWYES